MLSQTISELVWNGNLKAQKSVPNQIQSVSNGSVIFSFNDFQDRGFGSELNNLVSAAIACEESRGYKNHTRYIFFFTCTCTYILLI